MAMHDSRRSWFWSRTGLAVTLVVAVAAYFLLRSHTDHILANAPLLLLLVCPLMHVFMHGGRHGHRHDR